MLSNMLRTRRHVARAMIGLVAALTLLTATAVSIGASHNLGGPSAYRDCWSGNWERYEACVDANNWGANFMPTGPATFIFPDRDDVSLIVGRLPSY